MAGGMRLHLYEEETVEAIAHIVGPSSAARQALDELSRRRAAGERVAIYCDTNDGLWVVGPQIDFDE